MTRSRSSMQGVRQPTNKIEKPAIASGANRDGTIGQIGANVLNGASGVSRALLSAPGQAIHAAGNFIYENFGTIGAAGDSLLGLGAFAGSGAVGAAFGRSFGQAYGPYGFAAMERAYNYQLTPEQLVQRYADNDYWAAAIGAAGGLLVAGAFFWESRGLRGVGRDFGQEIDNLQINLMCQPAVRALMT